MDEPLHQPPRLAAHREPAPLRFLRAAKRLIVFSIAMIVLASVLFAGLLLYLRVQPMPPLSFSQSTELLDVHGSLIDSFHDGQNRHIVDLSSISPNMLKATLAIEDKRFYRHFGIDPRGLARAIWVNIRSLDANSQGASTLTQQLARNLFLTHEKTWSRKIKEAMYALQLEMAYTKDEILAMYLNQIYFGHGAYGIEAASNLYFGKRASELTLAESSMLAGVMKSWKYYSPHMDYERSRERQKLVLTTMAKQGVITDAEAAAVYAEELNLLPLTDKESSKAPYFRDYVRSVAVGKLGIDERLYDSGGLRIFTTLDLHAQENAEAAVAKYLEPHEELQAALVSIDPRNGHIQAMVGGRNYEENQYNRAFAETRQPGSSFKPILYLTALQQEGFTAVTRFMSEPTVFTYDEGRKTYSPQNYGNKYPNKLVDLRYAISKSDNIYAVNTMMQVGPERVIETAKSLGITSEMEPLPSLALGTYPVSPYEMASAFATIAGGGIRREPVAILRIEDMYGRVLYEAKPREQRVVAPQYTYILTHLMQSVFDDGGTGRRVSDLIKRPVAGKTGTTNTDAWMVGFTPELATAVWVGYDKGRAVTSVEAHTASPIFAEFTERTLSAVPPKLFEVPEGVTTVYIDPATGLLATADCPNPRLESFIAGTEPTESCTGHGAEPLPQDAPQQEQERNWWDDLKRWWNS
ncbi:transglycosylase domain-containing protein [Paenibacillus sp.]|uniref:transglycosylase domain-containing protein n=1 Tax=Paenibacillus sp. TaxID=58172 RepID=UPI002811C10A|nr:transglycosylase domain-containing protein [Paenibacillus sp.]